MKKNDVDAVALSIRSLSMDAIQKANSGHPGMPLGAAELAAVLFGEVMKHNPADANWCDRDRFVLSAGHASMLLYSSLHLSGYDISIDDIKNFRQVGAKCAGHPEYGMAEGIECTTGPLGQGVAMAVGMAVAESMLAARFNTSSHKIVDHYTYAAVGEGCLQEGVSQEACSLAGNLKLGKLIVFYDENKITIDGNISITFTDDIEMRFKAYGWQVLRGSMYDSDEIQELVKKAKADTEHPSLIILKSVIGKGAPKENTADVHGAPLGAEGVVAAKKYWGLPEDKDFYVVPEAYKFFEETKAARAKVQADWQKEFDAWAKANPDLKKQWDAFWNDEKTADVDAPAFEKGASVATRDASGKALNMIAKRYGNLVGGSADLTSPNKTKLNDCDGTYNPENRKGRMIEFGIREFAMSCVSAGITLHGGLRCFCATFAVFSDYLRPSLRVVALMKKPVIYVFSHDSIYVGEDGPTHQPIETLAALRVIPNVQVLRPGDAEETVVAWEMAYDSKDHPVCLATSRQGLSVYEKEDANWKTTMRRGAYIVQRGADKPDVTILASGSEVEMSLAASKFVNGKTVRVVSVPDVKLFASQDDSFKNEIIGGAARVVTAEAGVGNDWIEFATSKKDIFCINRFGESGPAKKVAQHLNFTAEKLAEVING